MAPRRRLILFGALALTVLAVFTVDRDEAPPAARREPPRTGSVPEPVAPPAVNTVADLKRREYATARGDLFPPHSWLPPMVATTEETPTGPPPLPFTYLGRMQEGRETVVFLLFQEKTVAVRRADVIDGTYRVEQITPQSMILVYLPLNEKQSLDFGSAN